MSQDGNNNLFGNFQPSPFDPSNLYNPDIASMQFAASVPQRPSSTTSQPQQHHVPMNFSSFPNHTMMPSHPSFSMNGYPASPYERPDSLGSNSAKQLQTKAERRAEHNATERARRESLNVKFQQLAFTLPNLQNDSRPSKGTIIDRTLDFVKGAIIKEERMQYRINELEKFSRYLLSELDKKNNVKEVVQEQEQEVVVIPSPVVETSSSPLPPQSITSEDSLEIKSDLQLTSSSPPPPLTTKKENGITNRRPVSRTSVPMIPKLDYTATTTTNWPITSTNHRLLQQQQQQLLLEGQDMMLKEQPMMPMTNNIFQHSFNPTTTPTTNMRFNQTSTEQQFMNPVVSDHFLFNHNNIMELHHRR